MDPIHQANVSGVPDFEQFAAEVPHQNQCPVPVVQVSQADARVTMAKQAPTMIDSIFEDSAQELSSVVDHSAAAVDAYN